MRNKKIDILCVGEILIDLISTDFADSMDEAESFKRIPGGSPANLGMNMKRLGNNVRLVSSVGNDDMGDFLINYVQKLGLDTVSMKRVNVPTTIILVTRSKNVSNFEAYRGADCQILMSQMPQSLLKNVSIFHTTCFALSKMPAQANILRGAKRAVENGCVLSIDVNYAQKIWQDQKAAQAVVAEYCSHGAFVKVSEVDWERRTFLLSSGQQKLEWKYSKNSSAAQGQDRGWVDQMQFVTNASVSSVASPVPVTLAVSNGLALLTWNAAPDKTYRVFYKDNLAPAQWSDMTVEVSYAGAVGRIKDATQGKAQRFYRVLEE